MWPLPPLLCPGQRTLSPSRAKLHRCHLLMIICRAHEAEYLTTPGGSLHFGPDVDALCCFSNIWGDFTADARVLAEAVQHTKPCQLEVSRKNSTGSFSLTANVFEKIHLCYKSAWLCWNYIKLHPQSIWAIIWFYKLYQDSIFKKIKWDNFPFLYLIADRRLSHSKVYLSFVPV